MSTIPSDAIPGVDLLEVTSVKHQLHGLADDVEGWTKIFNETRDELKTFIGGRDALAVLCKSTTYRLIQDWSSKSDDSRSPSMPLEQADVETLHALILAHGKESTVPTAPKAYERIWPTLSKSLFAFSRMQAKTGEDDALSVAIARVKMHTLYYRNPFYREDCERIMRNILKRIDDESLDELGFRLLSAFEMLIGIINETEIRLRTFIGHYRTLGSESSESAVAAATTFLKESSPLAARLVHSVETRKWDTKERSLALFQILDIAHSWIYTLDKSAVLEKYGASMSKFFDATSLSVGDLANVNPDHIYMNNPVWSHPFVTLAHAKIVLPEPTLLLSFPFRLFEPLIAKSGPLKLHYEEARASFLEDRIEQVLRLSLPSAEIYRNVQWTDPADKRQYENDVVAILGNHIFIFEAKSGRLDDAGRRGAPNSFKENLKALYVDPGEQAYRLQKYLADQKDKAVLKQRNGNPIDLKLGKPKLVHKYSVAMEHYASLTSGKRTYVELGLISNEDAWAPVLSIGDLEMLSRHLDTEISFFHYLTRRSSIEDLIFLSGDEQDLLSLYLTNGFIMDFDALKGIGVAFGDLDKAVRLKKIARADRTEVDTPGIPLSPLWKTFLRNIYDSRFPNKFDVIEALLNQSPSGLFELEKTVRRWRRGASGKEGETAMLHSALGQRVYLFSIYLGKRIENEYHWTQLARQISYNGGRQRVGATDCVTMLALKKSVESYDAISFHRYIDPQADIKEAVGGQLFGISPFFGTERDFL